MCPDRIQRLLRIADWNVDAVRDDVRDLVVEHVGEPGEVLIVDQTGFLKKGSRSAGVQRQYSGTAGRVENCQVGVFAAYASTKGHVFIDRQLYLPKSWTDARDRCLAAGIADDVEFATKPRMAIDMVARAQAPRVLFAWVTADEIYGQAKYLRIWLEEHDIAHVLAIKASNDLVGCGLKRFNAREAIAALPKRRGDGCRPGPAPRAARIPLGMVPIRPWWRPGRGHWLLARRFIARPDEIAYYVCFGPRRTRLHHLATVAGMRWRIEECFQQAKN